MSPAATYFSTFPILPKIRKIPNEVTLPLTQKRYSFIVVLVNFKFSGGTPGLNFRDGRYFKAFQGDTLRNVILDTSFCRITTILFYNYSFFFENYLNLVEFFSNIKCSEITN